MAETRKKGRLFDLPETKGTFQLRGVVTGMEKANTYREITTRSDRRMRMLNFGVGYEKDKTLYINLNGMELDNVYFSKKSGKKGEKPEVVKVPWADRFSFMEDDFRLIGCNVGVKKKVDSEGKTVNDKHMLTDFDACKEIAEHLTDGASVFIRGGLDYSSYVGNDGSKRTSIKLVPNQVSLCQAVDFDDEAYEARNDFNQVIIFMGIDPEKDDKGASTGRFAVLAKVVTYSAVEDVQFIIENRDLATKFKKFLKPYNAIKVSGHMVTSVQTAAVEDDDDEWGEEDAITKVTAPSRREFVITGAKGSTIDRELYTEANVTEAMAKITRARKAENDFGSDSDSDSDDSEWGSADWDADDEVW